MFNLRMCRRIPIPQGFYSSNTIFVHVPKAGGQAVSYAIYGCTTHMFKIHEVRNKDRRFYRSAFKFAIVRDPLDRFVSAVRYLKSGGRTAGDRYIAAQWCIENDLIGFINKISRKNIDEVESLRLFHTQNSFVTMPRNSMRVAVDKIYRMNELEYLIKDFNKVSEWPLEVRMPEMVNISKNNLDLSDRQWDFVKAFVKDMYAVDYKQFF